MIRFVLRILITLAVPILFAYATYNFINLYFFQPLDPDSTEKIFVSVTPEKSFAELCSELERKGVIRSSKVLTVMSRLLKESPSIKAGEYEFNASMPPKAVLDKLSGGEVFLRVVEVVPGMTTRELSKELERKGILKAEEFTKAILSEELLLRAGIRAVSFEGYLFPGSYEFSRGDSARHIIWTMMERGEEFWTTNQLSDSASQDNINMTRHEVLTLASILQAESDDENQQQILSAILHKRLEVGIPLESDATVAYGLPSYRGWIGAKERVVEHRFNTFVNFGLPIGPICNPGENAIRAALMRIETAAQFYVTNPDGGVIFSNTSQEHENEKKEYQEFLKSMFELPADKNADAVGTGAGEGSQEGLVDATKPEATS